MDNIQPNFIREVDFVEETIDVMVYLAKLLKNWKVVVKWWCIGVAVGAILAFTVVKSYAVSTRLLPEDASNAGSGLSSIASMAGINIGNGNSTDTITPELYPQIVGSLPFLVELLETPVIINTKEGNVNSDLYTYFERYKKYKWYKSASSYIGSLPSRLFWGVIELFKSDEEDPVEFAKSSIDLERPTIRESAIVGELYKTISVSYDKKTSVISVSVSMDDAEVAKQVCDRIVDKLQAYIEKYRTEKSRVDLDYYQKLNDEARDAYYEAQNKYAMYVDANQGIVLNSIMVERDRLQNESTLAFQLFNQTAQQLQIARAKVQMDTPVYFVLEPSTIPVRGIPSRSKVLIMTSFLFAFLSSLWVMFEESVTEFICKLKTESEK